MHALHPGGSSVWRGISEKRVGDALSRPGCPVTVDRSLLGFINGWPEVGLGRAKRCLISLHLVTVWIEIARNGVMESDEALLDSFHGRAQFKIGGAASLFVSGLYYRRTDQIDLHGLAVKSFLADSGTHFGDKGCSQLRVLRKASGRASRLEVSAAHGPINEDLGPGTESFGQRGLQGQAL